MTKAITDELGLPSLQDALKEVAAQQTPEVPAAEPANPAVEAMANALQGVNAGQLAVSDPLGTQEHESEADEIYGLAMKAHKDLMDLGFNIEPKHAGANAFTPSLKALEVALKASQSKANKKMERIRAIMDQEKHKKEMGENIEDGEIVESPAGGTVQAFRSDILDKIRKGEI